ncbi:DUF1559 family PulG-like putative transporter [Aporhodopirellula aestuarii]|uniref:DUF1559 domain-containing protein n=1 Tax=Aporhodopirellula aestuarii TaxID=2950107 RepID=A0ABT0U8W3_9BACT|nr:DUF1559 domain-containing protein [Aporhodopirellula aestuarii]MCM2373221.1 DUF1559 domain-containing protein [Aporhodopirellula aestuarii]
MAGLLSKVAALGDVYWRNTHRDHPHNWRPCHRAISGSELNPLNPETCGQYNGNMITPSSNHVGCCHLLMSDGAITLTADSIDAGSDSVHRYPTKYVAL